MRMLPTTTATIQTAADYSHLVSVFSLSLSFFFLRPAYAMARPQFQPTATVDVEPGLLANLSPAAPATNVTTTTTTAANLSDHQQWPTTFEDLVEAGLATLAEVITITPMLLAVAAVPAPPARTASAGRDFRQVTVTANNPRYGDLLATVNNQHDPHQWMTPRRVPYDQRARMGDIVFWPWVASPARRSLETTLQHLVDQGYRGGWTGVRIIMPRRDVLPSPRPQQATPELCYVFYRTSDWVSGPGVIVGAVTGRIKPFGVAQDDIPLDLGDASWETLQNATNRDAVNISTRPPMGVSTSTGGGVETW